MKKTAVAFFINTLEASGGTQRILTLLCNSLAEELRVFVFVLRGSSSFFHLDERVSILSLSNSVHNTIQRNVAIYKALKKHKCDYYVNLDSNSTLVNGLLLPRRTKLIVWEHFPVVGGYKRFLFSVSKRYVAIRAYKFVVLSNHEAAEWGRVYGLAKKKVVCITNPVGIKKPKNFCGSSYGRKNLLAVGNRIDVKGFDLLLDAWSGVESDWTLTIVGLSGEERRLLKKIAESRGVENIRIDPRSMNIERYYELSSAFILSSRKETAPLVLIESQAYGLPAIMFDHLPSALELVQDSAIVADFGNPVQSLKNAIETLIEDPDLHERLSKNALANSERFDISVFEESWLELLG